MSTDDHAAPRPADPATPMNDRASEPRVWLYAYSAAGQGVAIESQLQQLAATVAASRGAVAGRSSDTGSGYTSQRPGWDEAVAAVVAGRAAGVAVVDRDRPARSCARRGNPTSYRHHPAGGQLWTGGAGRLDVVDSTAPWWQSP